MPRPPSTKYHMLRVRIDLEPDQIQRALSFVVRTCERYILVQHILPHGNPHVHYFAYTNISQGNYSNKIKEEFKVSGDEYCVQKCDDDRKLQYFSYLFNKKHGNIATLVKYEGFSPLDIETFRANQDLVEKEWIAKVNASKKSQYDVAQLVLAKIGDKNPTTDFLYDLTIQTLKDCKMMARPYHVRDIIATVSAYSDSRQARDSMKAITLKFFSQ
jgi:hypothetical protein